MLRAKHFLIAIGAVLALTIAEPVQAQTPEVAVPAPGLGNSGAGPNGATLRCRDGSYPAPDAPDSACDGKGGVLVRFPKLYRPGTVPAAATPEPKRPAPLTVVRDTTPPEAYLAWRERQAALQKAEAQSRMPAGATLRCTDGTWVVRDTSSVRCVGHGGVKIRFAQFNGPVPQPD